MHQTKSFQNIKLKQNSQLNLDLFNLFSLSQKELGSPISKNYDLNLFSKKERKSKNKINYYSKKKENNKDYNIKEKRNYNISNYLTVSEKENNNQMNIRLNINNEIINNNFSEKKRDNKRQIYEDTINQKNNSICSLFWEIKEKINENNQMKKKNYIDNSENIISVKRKKKGSNQLNNNYNEKYMIQKIKDSDMISKNLKQMYKKLFFQNESKSHSKKNSISSTKNLILNIYNFNNNSKINNNYISYNDTKILR